jgi:acyl-CoA thioesterase
MKARTFTELVDVDAIGGDHDRAVSGSPLSRPTLFGGALVAQALPASAASTDPDKHPRRAFSARQVTVSRGDRVIRTAGKALPGCGATDRSE